jgi:predicted translation initiation factor SUI1
LEQSTFAANHFNVEAEKMDVWWVAEAFRPKVAGGANTAAPAEIAQENTVDDVQPSDSLDSNSEGISLADAQMIVALTKNSLDLIKQESASPPALDCWNLAATEQDSIRDSISRIMVMLILKGGKRPPNVPAWTRAASTPVRGGGKGKSGGKGAVAYVKLESKGRGGKRVTTISGLPLGEPDMVTLAKSLKDACGTGGTVKDGCIEIQGDQRDRIVSELHARGYKAKRSGG